MRNIGNIILLAGVLFLPLAAGAQDRSEHRDSDDDRNRSSNSRAYYDSRHRDWHQMDEKERQSYSNYAEQHHSQNKDFEKSNEREQQQYWNYRHKHPDSH